MQPINEERAFILIKTALESKAITLQGLGNNGLPDTATRAAKADAKYLVTLLNDLVKPSQP